MTVAEFVKYPFREDKRYELDDGKLILTDRPPYWHNHVSANLLFAVANFLDRCAIGEVLNSENVYALANDLCLSPDLGVILGDHRDELREATAIPIIPEIVAEVLSPSETPHKIHRKMKQYFEAGVKEVWLVHPEAREVEIWTGTNPPDTALTGDAVLESPLLPGFALPLSDLFE